MSPVIISDGRVNPIVNYLLRHIRNTCETLDPLNRLFYHNTTHTYEVIRRIMLIAEAMGLSPHDTTLCLIMAAGHDSVILWEMVTGDDSVIKRQLRGGINESLSASVTITAMQASEIPFTPHDYSMVLEGFTATIGEWCTVTNTVIQPYLNDCSCLPARALALADLGAAGMDPSCFAMDGCRLFAEENWDIMSSLFNAKRVSDIPRERQLSYRARLEQYLSRQPAFARGRQAHFSSELGPLRGSVEGKAVEALFQHFDASIEFAEATVEAARQLGFKALMRRLCVGAFPDEE